MRSDDAPSVGKTDPCLALPSALRAALKFQRDAGKVFTKADNVEPRHSARQICCRPVFTKFGDFFMTVKIFGRSEAHRAWISPEHFHKLFHVIGNKGCLIVWIELA